METVLYIGTQKFPPKSARNCTQILKMIDSGTTKRTVNGELIKLRGVKKLWTRITCTDQKIPPIWDFDIGDIIQIGCIQRLYKKVTPGNKINLKHDCSPNSLQGHDKNGQVIWEKSGYERTFLVPKNVEFISYLPWLDMMITKIETKFAEWDVTTSWMLEAEEV